MSFLSRQKPISSIYAFSLNGKMDFCCKNFSILTILTGSCSSPVVLNTGDFITLPPRRRLTLESGSDAIIAVIEFNNYILLSVLESTAVFDAPTDSSTHMKLTVLSTCIEKILQMYQRSESTISYFEFVERLNQLFPSGNRPMDGEGIPEKTKELLTFIHANLFSGITLNETAAALHITPQYLASFFQKNFGMTFKEYLNQLRAEHALPLIRFTEMTFEAIAGMIGFASAASMDKSISAIYGESCRRLREHYAHPESFTMIPAEQLVPNYTDYLSGVQVADNTPEEPLPDNSSQELSVRSASPINNMTQSWKSILNLGSATYMEQTNLRDQISYAQAEIHFQYGRILDLLNLTSVHDVRGQIFYGFEQVFKLLDFMLDRQLTPFIALGNKYDSHLHIESDPYQIDSREGHHSYYKKLLKVLPMFIRSCCNRYGSREVAKWRFEVCLDHTLSASNRQTLWQYLNYFSQIRDIIQDHVSECQVGGPGFYTVCSVQEFENLLKLAASEHVTFDFISLYLYGNTDLSEEAGLDVTGYNYIARVQSCMDTCKSFRAGIPIFITEFGLLNNRRNYLNDSMFAACTVSWIITRFMDSVDGLGYCSVSDLTVGHADSKGLLFGGSGMFNHLGIPKPIFYAFEFLKQLGGMRLNHNPGILITGKNKFSFQVFMYNCPPLTELAAKSLHNEQLLRGDTDTYEPMSPKTVTITLSNAVPGIYLIKEYRVSRFSGSLLGEYSKIRNVEDLADTDIACLTTLSQPHAALSSVIVDSDGTLSWPVSVHPLEIILIHIDYNSKGDSNGLSF